MQSKKVHKTALQNNEIVVKKQLAGTIIIES